jgi:hypothetical protein
MCIAAAQARASVSSTTVTILSDILTVRTRNTAEAVNGCQWFAIGVLAKGVFA